MFPNGDFMFEFGPIFIEIIFVIVIATILVMVFRGISRWNQNNHSPKLNVNAMVVGKRMAVRGGGEHRTYSRYYVTFEVESGDRMELEVKDAEYGILAEGDQGELSFQGTRYHGFIRDEQTTGLGN